MIIMPNSSHKSRFKLRKIINTMTLVSIETVGSFAIKHNRELKKHFQTLIANNTIIRVNLRHPNLDFYIQFTENGLICEKNLQQLTLNSTPSEAIQGQLVTRPVVEAVIDASCFTLGKLLLLPSQSSDLERQIKITGQQETVNTLYDTTEHYSMIQMGKDWLSDVNETQNRKLTVFVHDLVDQTFKQEHPDIMEHKAYQQLVKKLEFKEKELNQAVLKIKEKEFLLRKAQRTLKHFVVIFVFLLAMIAVLLGFIAVKELHLFGL